MPTSAATTKGGTTLLIVDAQNDFHPGGSLAVPNSDKDAERIASLIRSSISDDKSKSKIDRIVATLDSHHVLHIAHPKFWSCKDGKHPTPFTLISSDDIKAGKWVPRKDLKLPVGKKLVDASVMKMTEESLYDKSGNLNLLAYCIEYTKRLEQSGKFVLCIWPEHCLIGSPGHCIHDNIRQAMYEWSDATGNSIEFVMKGQNLLTEMYSALRAEVEICPETSLNKELLASLKLSDQILICGQALSHCVNHTARDLIDNMPGEEHKVIILSDCASSVPTFEKDGEKFIDYVIQRGSFVREGNADIFH
jgi:nicotinamidase/pyrazinamidase